MALTTWDELKAQVGYDELPTQGKVDTINGYSDYIQEYFTSVEPRDPKEVGSASDEFVKSASQEVLGDLGAVERASAFLGNFYKGASGTFTSAFKAAALAQQAIGESLGNYDDSTPVTDRDLYKMAQNVDESVRQTTGIEDPRLRGDFINTLLPSGLGSVLGFVGASAVAAAAVPAEAPAAVAAGVGMGAAGIMGALTNAGGVYEEAKQSGADEFTSRASALAAGVVGLSEAIPMGGLGARLTAGLAKRSILRGVVEGATEEFLQETGSQMANNFIASKFAGYDPNRGIMDGALQSGAVGLVTGGMIGGGVNAITRDNEAFYADRVSDDIRKKADLAASLTPERMTQIAEAARNANTSTQQKINIETGETETTSTPRTVFGDRVGGEVPDIGENPAINSVPLGRSVSQDADGKNTETFTFHTPQGLLWEAEFKTGEPVKVRDVTDDSPLLNPITSPADPKTATRSQFTGRIISPTSSIAKEFGLETEQEMDRRLIAEAQRDMQLGKATAQDTLPDNQIIPESVSRDDRGVARQAVLNKEIERLYKIREAVLAKQILVGGNPNTGTTEYDPNTAREVIKYDSEGNKIENKQSVSRNVARLNRMIGMRETELRGLTSRPEGYILASERNTPPSASQKLSLVQGFQNLWNSISSPALRNAITFEVGDITPLIESGQVPKGAVAYYKRASDGRKAMIFLSDKLATMPMARREMIHELGHAFWDTLPAGVQAEIRGLWKAETESRTGALFDEFGGLRAEVSPRVMDSVQEFFSERLAWTNDQWAKGISEKNSIMDKAGRAFRNLLDRFLRYTGHGERLNLEFRSFLDQGDRFNGLRTRVDQVVQAARAAINEEPQASTRKLSGSSNIEVKNERVKTTGKYVGLPEEIDSPEKLEDLKQRLQALAIEGEEGRFWYEESSQKILEITGGNIKDAEMLVAFIAVYSPQNKVYPNWGQALRAYAEYKRGEKIQQGKTGRDVENGQLVANGERWEGIKTHNFYHNLMLRIDPSQTVSAATVDMWIMRVLGYATDSASKVQYKKAEDILKEVAQRLGWEPQQVQAAIWVIGKAKWEEVIWPELKQEAKDKGDFIQVQKKDKKVWDFRNKDVAQEYRQRAIRRVFTSMKVDMSDAASNFSNMARRNLATVGIETRLGTTTGETWQDNLSVPELLQYHKQKEQILTDSNGYNIVFREFGVPVDSMYNAVGLWKSQTNPLSNYEIPSYRETIGVRFKLQSDASDSQLAELNKAFGDGYVEKADGGYRVKNSDDERTSVEFDKYANKKIKSIFGGNASIVDFYTDKNIRANIEDAISAIGILFKQDGMAWHQPFEKASVGDSNGIRFGLGRQTTPSETARLNDELGKIARSLNINEYDFSVVNDRNGFRVLKFNDAVQNTDFHRFAQDAVGRVFGGEMDIEVDRFGFDGNLITNDWSTNKDGEVYRQRISESGRSDVFGRLEDNLRPQIERLDAHWRGVAESGGRAGTESAGRQGAGTQQSPQGRGIQEAGSPEVRASTRGESSTNPLAVGRGRFNPDEVMLDVKNLELPFSERGTFPRYIVKVDGDSVELTTPLQLKKFIGDISGSDKPRIFRNAGKGITIDFDSTTQASTRGEQAQRILEPVISFGRQQLRTGGALPYDIFRMTEQRGFNVNEKLLRAQNAVSDIEAAVKRSYAKSLDQLPAEEIARINEGLQNPLARARLPTDVASAVGNARNLIDSLTQDLLRSGAISEDLQPILEANKGVYLHRSYEKWENPNYKNPFNTLPKQVQNKLVTTVTSYLHNKYANAYAKEQSLARGEVAINPNSGTYQADYQAGLAKARSGGVTKAEVDGQIEYLASPETDSPFGQIGSGLTKDLSIITARKNIPEEIRMLWGEIKDPRVNFLKSVQKMSGFLEAHNMLKGMRDAGMNKIFFTTPRTGFTTKLVSDGSRTASPLNMFIDGMKNDVYTSEEISTALRNTFGGRAKAQDFLGKMGELYLKANGFSKFAKTVLSVQTQVRNLLGNGSFLVANGYIFSPDGITALNKLKTLALPSAGTQLGINKSKEFRDYNAKLTRLGILGQSVFANEMESYFKDANVNTAADFLDNHVTKGLKAIARGATSLYQLGDAIPKIVAFEVELSRLRKAYPTQPLSKLEPMAADKVLNLLPTYSRIPRLGNVLRSQPFVGAFISFPLEVVRTGYNLLGTINDELRSDNPAVRQAGAYRLAGTMMASIGFSAVAAGIAAAMGIDDDEDKAIRKLDAPWDKYATKLYLGRDEKGNVNQVNLSYVDPYNYFRDPIIALMKMDGTWDQKLLESVKTAFQPLYGEQILSGKVLDIARNTKGTTGGRVYNPEADLASKASAISAHMFDAFNIGTFTSSIRIYKGLTGQVTQTGRAYDPALETIATLTGQRVVSLDPRQSLGFAARKFSNRLNDATGIFTAAYYDRSNVSNEARMEAYKQMSRSRKEIFNDTAGTISAAMKLGVSRGEVMRILKEQGVSMDNSRALLSGLVAVYKPAKREMKGDAIRFRQQVYAGQ